MYDRLKRLCDERGTTVTKLCEIVTGSSGNLATWKKGYMRSDYLLKVAQYFGVSVDYLLGYTPNEQSDGKTEKLLTFASKLTDEQLDAFIDSYSRILEQLK